jgi:hypothetical protein
MYIYLESLTLKKAGESNSTVTGHLLAVPTSPAPCVQVERIARPCTRFSIHRLDVIAISRFLGRLMTSRMHVPSSQMTLPLF